MQGRPASLYQLYEQVQSFGSGRKRFGPSSRIEYTKIGAGERVRSHVRIPSTRSCAWVASLTDTLLATGGEADFGRPDLLRRVAVRSHDRVHLPASAGTRSRRQVRRRVRIGRRVMRERVERMTAAVRVEPRTNVTGAIWVPSGASHAGDSPPVSTVALRSALLIGRVRRSSTTRRTGDVRFRRPHRSRGWVRSTLRTCAHHAARSVPRAGA